MEHMNRENRRKIEKKYGKGSSNFVKSLSKILSDNDKADKIVFAEGTRVRINADKVTLGNSKRIKWFLEHVDEIFTVEYDPKWGDRPNIYCLKEDQSDPKWYFTHFELDEVDE